MKILNTPAMRRMPTYLHQLFHLRLSGQEWVSCADLAKYMSIPHVMVRKDIGMTGLPGNKRHGFKVNDLIGAILRFFGWDKTSSATLTSKIFLKVFRWKNLYLFTVILLESNDDFKTY